MKCGVCGDNYKIKQPRPNENTGRYGVGIVVRNYTQGQVSAQFNGFLFHDNQITALSRKEEAVSTQPLYRIH